MTTAPRAPRAPRARRTLRALRAAPRALIAIGAALAFLLVGAVPAQAESPIQPDNRPKPVEGQENGEMTADQLVRVASGCRAYRDAAPSLNLMLESAAAEGIGLGTNECYRLLDDQVAAQQRWSARGNSACAAVPRTKPDGSPKGTSMHGWGKAGDFTDTGRGMTFSSQAYKWLKGNAGRLGWNHPGWAEPGGSACPEAWHWEWVGDGGTKGADSIRVDVTDVMASTAGDGYSVVTALGGVAHRGDAVDHGNASKLALQWVVVGGARSPLGGYWLVSGDGGVFAYGADFYGSAGNIDLKKPIVGMAATPTGNGYWLVASDGGIFAYGDAKFHGSTGAMTLNRPIVGMAATPTGQGYWLVASDGGIFAFGDAVFHGSTGGIKLNRPVVSMVRTATGDGYWLVATDGGVFSFGNATFHGSAGNINLRLPIVAMAATPTGNGYWQVAADGGVFTYGAANFHGAG